MFRLIATTLAGIYVVLAVWGREPQDDIEVTRAATLDGGLGPGAAEADIAGAPAPMGRRDDLRDVSAEEAVRMALAAGEAEPQTPPEAAEPLEAPQDPAAAAEAADERWYVTGANVNLRAGPSSGDRVVGRVGLGDRAEPLSDTAAPWIRIRTEAGEEAWIYGRYLAKDPA